MISAIKHKEKVGLHYLTKIRLDQRKKLKKFLIQITQKEKKKLTRLDYIFCSDQYLLTINQRYLHHNEFTDIISFNFSDTDHEIVGEIYISADRVKENAVFFKSPFRKELHRVIFHGLLHLCGYKDKSQKDIAMMRKKEDYYLSEYFDNQ